MFRREPQTCAEALEVENLEIREKQRKAEKKRLTVLNVWNFLILFSKYFKKHLGLRLQMQ